MPFDTTLQRTPPDDRVVILGARFSPADVESARRARVDTALERKCPKLAEAKREFGATSVLILESDDIALANRHTVSATVIEAIRSREGCRTSFCLSKRIADSRGSCGSSRRATGCKAN